MCRLEYFLLTQKQSQEKYLKVYSSSHTYNLSFFINSCPSPSFYRSTIRGQIRDGRIVLYFLKGSDPNPQLLLAYLGFGRIGAFGKVSGMNEHVTSWQLSEVLVLIVRVRYQNWKNTRNQCGSETISTDTDPVLFSKIMKFSFWTDPKINEI